MNEEECYPKAKLLNTCHPQSKDTNVLKWEESAGRYLCPNCGYCPTCGRPQNVPIYPTYPYNPGLWFTNPWTVTSGNGGVHTSV